MFRGKERFSTKYKATSSDASYLEPTDWTKASGVKSKGWVKSTTPRFGPEKKSPTADAEMYVPPGIGERSVSPSGSRAGSACFKATADRFAGSPLRSRSAEPGNGPSGPQSVFVPPGIADEILKTKRGSSYFRGTERFAFKVKSETLNCDMYSTPGLAEEVMRSRSNPLKASSTSRFKERKDQKETGPTENFIPKGMGDIPRKAGGKSTFGGSADRFPPPKPSLSAKATHLDPNFGTIAGEAEKVRGKQTWSKQTGHRGYFPKPNSNPADQYMPKPFGSDSAHVPSWAKATTPRFKDTNTALCSAPYYDPPSFVEMILRK